MRKSMKESKWCYSAASPFRIPCTKVLIVSALCLPMKVEEWREAQTRGRHSRIGSLGQYTSQVERGLSENLKAN